MTTSVTYATAEELAAYVGGRYTLPMDIELLLRNASRLLDRVCLGRAIWEWKDPLPDPLSDEQVLIKEAVCAQVEYWLELGVEQSVAPQPDNVQLGALQLPRPDRLAAKAKDALLSAGLLYRGVATVGW